MTQVEHIQAEIESLSQEDFIRLREWFSEKDWSLWDKQLETDIAEEKLDFLIKEAMEAKYQGELQDLFDCLALRNRTKCNASSCISGGKLPISSRISCVILFTMFTSFLFHYFISPGQR